MPRHFARLVFVLLFIGPLAVFAADWNQWRGAGRNGYDANSPALIDQLPSEGLKPLWLASEGIPASKNGGWSSPVVADGRVFLFAHEKIKMAELTGKPKYPYLPPEKRTGMSDAEYEEYEKNRRDEQEARSRAFRFSETLFCLNAETGKQIWKTESKSVYTRFAQSSTPAVVDGRVFVLGAGRMARCFQAEDGSKLWETKLPGEFRDEFMQSSFAIVDNIAVVRAGELFGLNVETGEIIWQTDEDASNKLHASPAIWRHGDKAYVIVNAERGETVCVDPTNGKELWRVKSEAGHSTPIVFGDTMLTYASSRKGGLRRYDLSLEKADRQWTFTGAADPGGCPVIVGDYVYVQGDRRLACVNLKTGDEEWTTMLDLERPRYTSLVAADDLVIYAFDGVLAFEATPKEFRPQIVAKVNNEGLMNSVEAFEKQLKMNELRETAEGQRTAEKVWRTAFNNSGPLQCSSPAIHNGRLYLRMKNGVGCYELKKK